MANSRTVSKASMKYRMRGVKIKEAAQKKEIERHDSSSATLYMQCPNYKVLVQGVGRDGMRQLKYEKKHLV